MARRVVRSRRRGDFKASIVIRNENGLHTRPSTELVKCAARFRARVFLRYGNARVNAKSLLGILTLAAAKGARIVVEAEGEDAEVAVRSLLKLSEARFNTAL